MSGQNKKLSFGECVKQPDRTTDIILIGHRYLSGGIVKILVGPEAVQFDIHRQLLCARSAYFAKALSGPWKESKGTLKLPEDDADLFRFISHWLYTEDVDHTKLSSRIDGVRASLRLYVLADKLQVRAPIKRFGVSSGVSFLNVVEHDMRDSNTTLNCDEVDYIYENTLGSSPLRQFAVHLSAFAFYRLGTTIQVYRQSFENTPEFAMDLCKRMVNPFTPLERIKDPRGLPDPGPFDHKPFGHRGPGFAAPSVFGVPSTPAATAPLAPVPANFPFSTPVALHNTSSAVSALASIGGLASALPTTPSPSTSVRPISTFSVLRTSSGIAENEHFQSIFATPGYEHTSPEASKHRIRIGLASLTSCRS